MPNYISMKKMYSHRGLPSSPIFHGGWINFGYWEGIDIENPTILDRENASEALYDQLFIRMKPNDQSSALEAGCGRGLGCLRLHQRYDVATIAGIDISQNQINEAKRNWLRAEARGSAQFVIAPAEVIPFQDGTFNHIYSVEAVQHFQSLQSFFREAHRVMTPRGTINITTMFAVSRASIPRLGALLPTVKMHLDRITAENDVTGLLNELGFANVQSERIGQHVFSGFDRWIEKTLGPKSWGHNWYKAYRENLIDYFVISAEAA